MKITIDNFQEKFPLIKKYLPEPLVNMYPAQVTNLEFYKDSENCKKSLNLWISTVNSILANTKIDETDSKKPLKHKYAKGKRGKVTGKRKKGEKKEEKKATKRKYGKGKGGKVTGKRKKGEKKPDTKKPDTKKPAKEKTANKPKKESYAVTPYWYKILFGFRKMAGTTKETWRIQNFFEYIQDSCASERNRKTPFIEIIRKIQSALMKYVNVDRHEIKKQALPEWKALCTECKNAMKTVTISSKTGKKPSWEEKTLAG